MMDSKEMKVVDWFEPDSTPSYASLPFDWRTDWTEVRESEKAVLIAVACETRDGERDITVNVWVPKKCFENRKEWFAKKQEREQRHEVAFEAGKERYEKLIGFCRDNGVKGIRIKMRAVTILEKIKSAGLTYNY